MAGSVEILIKYYRIRHTLMLYSELSATEAKILIQLRSGHANLCKYFHRTKMLAVYVDTPRNQAGISSSAPRGGLSNAG